MSNSRQRKRWQLLLQIKQVRTLPRAIYQFAFLFPPLLVSRCPDARKNLAFEKQRRCCFVSGHMNKIESVSLCEIINIKGWLAWQHLNYRKTVSTCESTTYDPVILYREPETCHEPVRGTIRHKSPVNVITLSRNLYRIHCNYK